VLSSHFNFSFHEKGKSLKPIFFIAAAAVCLSACAPRLVEKLPYYKLSVVQGVPLDAASVLALRPGMTRQQVALEIGTPLLNNAFRTDRWDYVYEIVRGGKVKEHRNLSVYFNADDTVSRVEGSALDYAREQAAATGSIK